MSSVGRLTERCVAVAFPKIVERDLMGAWRRASIEVCRLAGRPHRWEAITIFVVGVDVHKYSLTAVAVDELGRILAEHSGAVGAQVIGWARSLDSGCSRIAGM
jgi:hypothetical protein